MGGGRKIKIELLYLDPGERQFYFLIQDWGEEKYKIRVHISWFQCFFYNCIVLPKHIKSKMTFLSPPLWALINMTYATLD